MNPKAMPGWQKDEPMTPTNDAEKALELLAKEIFDYRDSPSTPKTIQKAIETIRTALAKSAKVDDVIRELEFIKVVSSVNVRSAYDNDMSMYKLCTIRIHAERAIKQFSGEA